MTPHQCLVVVSIVLGLTMAGCGDDTTPQIASSDVSVASSAMGTAASPAAGEFCEAMGHLIVLLAPTADSNPDETRATFTEASGWFEQANTFAPAEIADDFADYKTAYDGYRAYLSSVDFNLNTVFGTSEGRQLAIDTSHTLTPAIVEHVIGTCGLSFGDEQRDPPTTTGG